MYKRVDGRWQENLPIVVNGQKKTKFFYGRTKREVLEKINQYEQEQEQTPRNLGGNENERKDERTV